MYLCIFWVRPSTQNESLGEQIWAAVSGRIQPLRRFEIESQHGSRSRRRGSTCVATMHGMVLNRFSRLRRLLFSIRNAGRFRGSSSLARRLSFMMLLPFVVATNACSPKADEDIPGNRYSIRVSPDGKAEADVYQSKAFGVGHTQVGITWTESGCGSGSAAFDAYDLGIELSWINSEILQVIYPDGHQFSHNVSGDFLVCGSGQVRVVMVPASAVSVQSEGPSAPVEADQVDSPAADRTAYTIRYSSAQTGVTLVVVDFKASRGCRNSALTFYDEDIEIDMNWLENDQLEISFPAGASHIQSLSTLHMRCASDSVFVSLAPR